MTNYKVNYFGNPESSHSKEEIDRIEKLTISTVDAFLKMTEDMPELTFLNAHSAAISVYSSIVKDICDKLKEMGVSDGSILRLLDSDIAHIELVKESYKEIKNGN